MKEYGSLAALDLEQCLERIAAGEYQADIAKEHGCTPAALTMALKRQLLAERVHEAQEIGMQQRLDERLRKCEDAADAGDVNLARAHEVPLRRLEWRAEREHARWAQQRSTVQIQAEGPVSVTIVEYGSSIPSNSDNAIDGDAQVVDV